MKELRDLVAAWRGLPQGTEAVLATVVATHGSVYRRPGARMLLTREEWIAGSISGGCLESDLISTAFERTEQGAVVVTYDSTAPDDILLGFGLGCSGIVEVLMQRLPADGGPLSFIERVLETNREGWIATYADGSWEASFEGSPTNALLVEQIAPPPKLIVFGAGHDAVPLTRIAKEIGWHVTVVDGRTAYARTDRFPQADDVRVCHPTTELPIEKGAFVVVMTHSFANDRAILKWVTGTDAQYIGILGPAHRTQRLLEELELPGDHLFAPIGLDLGAEGPDEIALAIVAEMLSVRNARAGGHLKGRKTPLHARSI